MNLHIKDFEDWKEKERERMKVSNHIELIYTNDTI